MKVTPVRTRKIIPGKDTDIFAILDTALPRMSERSILAVTSKIVSICEGRIVPIGQGEKNRLIKQEAEYYLPPETNRYHFTLTIKYNLLIPTAGIDESNGNGYYILWPSHPQRSANAIRKYLKNRFSLKKVGVIITDSRTTPLRRGVTGTAIAHSGFQALKDYRGKPDIFGRKLKVTRVNIMDALGAAAVLIMGEGKERTPLAVIEDVPFVQFQARDPTRYELKTLHISIEEDLYAPLLRSARWQKGGMGRRKLEKPSQKPREMV